MQHQEKLRSASKPIQVARNLQSQPTSAALALLTVPHFLSICHNNAGQARYNRAHLARRAGKREGFRSCEQSHRESIDQQTLQIVGQVMSASLPTSGLGFAMNLYNFQEFLAVLLLLAVLTATILVFAVAFVLFQEGIRRAVLWAKTSVVRVVGLSPKSS